MTLRLLGVDFHRRSGVHCTPQKNFVSHPARSGAAQRSLRCYALGWWGLVPVVGLVPALLAFAEFRAVVLRKGGQWNAARPQLLLGAWLAGVGVFLSLTIVVIVCVAIAETW